jgi:hypothetical protein
MNHLVDAVTSRGACASANIAGRALPRHPLAKLGAQVELGARVDRELSVHASEVGLDRPG